MTGPMFPECCPGCGSEDMHRPALSRFDNKSYVCPMCGAAEAISAMVLGPEHPAVVMLILGRQADDWSMWTAGLQLVSDDPLWLEYYEKIQESFRLLREQEGSQ